MLYTPKHCFIILSFYEYLLQEFVDFAAEPLDNISPYLKKYLPKDIIYVKKINPPLFVPHWKNFSG